MGDNSVYKSVSILSLCELVIFLTTLLCSVKRELCLDHNQICIKKTQGMCLYHNHICIQKTQGMCLCYNHIFKNHNAEKLKQTHAHTQSKAVHAHAESVGEIIICCELWHEGSSFFVSSGIGIIISYELRHRDHHFL